MPLKLIGFIIATISIAFLLNPETGYGQRGGKSFGGKGGFPPQGGSPFGGGGNSPFGGGGMQFGGKGMDYSMIFDRLANGRNYFYASDSRMFSEPLAEFARAQGITDGKITREHMPAFSDFMKARMSGGGGFSPKGSPGPGGPIVIQTPGSPTPPGAPDPDPTEAWNKMAEWKFKDQDQNNDGFLNMEEMPRNLREELGRWDTNRDNLLDLPEFKNYFMARMKEGFGRDFQKWNPAANPIATAIIIEEEWDKRPTVMRAGKLPKEMPKWFAELDTNVDGQVSLAEWRRGDKDIDDYKKYDRNDDGLLTPEEVLRQEGLAKNGNSKDNPTIAFNFGGNNRGPDAGKSEEKKKGKGGWGDMFKKGGGGDWFKKKKKGE